MAKKRRNSGVLANKASPAAIAMSSSPLPNSLPTTPTRPRRLNLSSMYASRSGVAASTRSQRTTTQLPVLSPPLKKRVTSRRMGKAVKLQLPDDDVAESHGPKRGIRSGDTESAHNEEKVYPIKPDSYLPEAYQHRSTVLQHAGSYYDAMLIRASVTQHHSEFIALQALKFDEQFYLYTRAGSIGCPGKTTLAGPFSSTEKVTLQFCTVFATNTHCEWEDRHALRYQEGSYTWIELDHSNGPPFSESLPSAVADNQGKLHNANSFQDMEIAITSPAPSPAQISSRKRRRASMWTTTQATTVATSKRVRRGLHTQCEWLYASGEETIVNAESTDQLTCAPVSELPVEVQDFLSLIADQADPPGMATGTKEVVDETQMKLPLGRLSKTTIQRGYETLEEIYQALCTRPMNQNEVSNLSNQFYSFIPHCSHLKVIDTMVKLGKKVQLMAEVGANVRGIMHEPIVRQCGSRNYLDECYHLLKCELYPVNSSHPDYALIQTYIRNSNCCGRNYERLQLLAVFRVKKPEQEAHFAMFRNLSNRRILWHGSHLDNWLGILSEGLRIAPPEVTSNGRTFGKGLYFTDKVTKAQAYCHTRPTNSQNQCVLALSEVALGKSKEMVNSDDRAKIYVHTRAGGHAKENCNYSCHGLGSCRPDTAGEFVDFHGTIWPVGKCVHPEERTDMHHSEYIIYNPHQTRMRFVVLARMPE
ncbi:hypothetical protein CCR75_005239 [Bremia lactucae]|uniref:Poly [ADP-ribose] polymerase n=1 Tax=Bremia lactucae TaxID=4779 RepID=A0A976FSM1_BRELC|nr:hypothetical protein CCR75_005239 [Bremia lactucae]